MQKTKTNEVTRIVKFDEDNFQIIIDVPNIHDMQRPVHRLAVDIDMENPSTFKRFVEDTGFTQHHQFRDKILDIGLLISETDLQKT